MANAAATSCPECQRLKAQLEEQRAQLRSLQATVATLQEQLASARKNSSTSSKPPSSDIVKPPKAPDGEQQAPRSIGGQPGHPKHERAPFPPEQITLFDFHLLQGCPCCGGQLRPNGGLARVVQQVDVLQPPLVVEQHVSPEYWCVRCEKAYKAPMPAHIEKGGLVGLELTILVAYLKGACHASFSTVRKFLRDVVKVTISRSQLAKVILKVSAALDGPYRDLLEELPGQPVLNADETGHKENGDRMWTWCFRASLYTLFKIDPTRSADVLLNVLGAEFDGVLGCDYFSSYRSFQKKFDVRLQFCLAHLIRDVKFLTTLPDARDRAYGEELRRLFGVIHRRGTMSAREFGKQLEEARKRVLYCGTTGVPPTRHSQNLAKRLRENGEGYFRFITTPGLEPTNNSAEQAIRFVVIDRLITQGTRGEAGRRWSERIWTVMATCAQQGRSVYEYLGAAVKAHFHGEEAPSLLPGTN